MTSDEVVREVVVHGTAFDDPRANSTWKSWSVPVRKAAIEPVR